MLRIWKKISRHRYRVNMHICTKIGSSRSNHLFVVHNRIFCYRTHAEMHEQTNEHTTCRHTPSLRCRNGVRTIINTQLNLSPVSELYNTRTSVNAKNAALMETKKMSELYGATLISPSLLPTCILRIVEAIGDIVDVVRTLTLSLGLELCLFRQEKC